MKKILLTIGLAAALVSSSQAQGTLNFVNAAATVITLTSNSVSLGSTPAALGGFRYELFIAPAGTIDANSFTATGLIATNTTAGRFVGGNNLVVPGTPSGGTAAIMIRGWSSNLGSTWNAAFANQGVIAGFFGQSAIAPNFFTGGVPAGGGPALNASPVFGGLSGIVPLVNAAAPNGVGFTLNYVPVVPEPSSMALAGLGAAALMIFRRRKN